MLLESLGEAASLEGSAEIASSHPQVSLALWSASQSDLGMPPETRYFTP